MVNYYPVMWKLSGKKCLIVGGGHVAERKVKSLLEAGAHVTVVSPALTDQLTIWNTTGMLKARMGLYESSDIKEDYVLAIAATNDPAVNAQVVRDARAYGVPIISVDDPEAGDFIVPAVLRRGRLVMAISTSGASPVAATQIRDQLERQFGDEYEIYFDFLHEYRIELHRMNVSGTDRRVLMHKVMELDLLAKIREGSFSEWKKSLREELQQWSGQGEGGKGE